MVLDYVSLMMKMKHGGLPGRNLSPAVKTLSATGNMKAIYCAIAPTLNTAPIAIGDANMRSPRRAPRMPINQTAFTGVFVREFTIETAHPTQY